MRERHVVVSDVIEEVNLFLLQHQTSSDGVYRSVAPSLIEKAAIAVEGGEEIDIGF